MEKENKTMDGKKKEDKISVKKYKWISESYGLGYYDFEIEVITNNEQYPIYRRFSEIEYLNELLLLTSPGCLIPPLPEKNMMTNFSYHSEEFMKERMNQIDFYLNKLMRHSHLSYNKHFQTFIANRTFDKRKELESKKSLFSSFKNMFGLSKGSKLETSDKIVFYDKEDKENIQRLAKGVKEILNSYENYFQINSNKRDSLNGIRNLSNDINKFSLSLESNSQDKNETEKIIEKNCDYLKKISEKIDNSNQSLRNKLDQLKKYLNLVENLEKIFLRLDLIKAGQFEVKVDIDMRDIDTKTFKEQLEDEIKLFREYDEKTIFIIIQDIFDIQIIMNKSIREIFDEKKKEELA